MSIITESIIRNRDSDDTQHRIDMLNLRDKLNDIIDSHNLISDEIEGITSQVSECTLLYQQKGIEHIDKV